MERTFRVAVFSLLLAGCSSEPLEHDSERGGGPKGSEGGNLRSGGGGGFESGTEVSGGGPSTPGGGGSLGGAGNAPSSGDAPITGGAFPMGSGGLGEPGAGGSSGGLFGTGGSPASGGSLSTASSPYFPEPGSFDQCPDPTIRIRFDGPPKVGNRGEVRIYDTANPNLPTYRIDLSTNQVTDTIGGSSFQLPRPVYIYENEVVFALPSAGLAYGKTYAVTIDEGVVSGPDGEAVVVNDIEDWQFSTATAAPSNKAQLSVGLDGTASFCGVQKAIEAAAPGATLSIAKGAYFGVIYFQAKNDLSLVGAGRDTTLLLGVNNNNLNPSTRGRALFGTEKVSGLSIENLTIENQTPQGGSQAEALTLLSCDKCIVKNSTIRSLQDTLLWSGRVYAEDSLIVGNVDYVWGTGTAYFNRVEIKTVGRKGYNVQARNTTSNYGYVFVDSKLSADPGITGDVLARIDVSAYPSSHVAYIDCEMGPHIGSEGWLITGAGSTAGLRFWEYGSHDANGDPIDTSQRAAGSRQLSASEALQMRDPSVVLNGWDPR